MEGVVVPSGSTSYRNQVWLCWNIDELVYDKIHRCVVATLFLGYSSSASPSLL